MIGKCFRFMRHAVVLAAAATIAGCNLVQTEFDNAAASSANMASVLDARANSSFAAVPSVGSARFRGHTIITIDPSDPSTLVRGDALIDVDFLFDDVTGTLDNFVGVNGSGQYAYYDGYISIATGDVGGSLPNDVSAIYSGNLTGNGEKLILFGEMQGKFKGTPIVGLTMEETNAVMDRDGSLVVGSIEVVALDD